ncbi:hypothetical protein PR048_029956 [Dryococelus australis]|uniref:Uncharacterized protein n=1 Tax=Dryococelus australis TaxID=614101 RepID=A0ABQ9G7M7_9NEOP|nr:hypothetical protein PR048_029956 [Dryococelus australis]
MKFLWCNTFTSGSRFETRIDQLFNLGSGEDVCATGHNTMVQEVESATYRVRLRWVDDEVAQCEPEAILAPPEDKAAWTSRPRFSPLRLQQDNTTMTLRTINVCDISLPQLQIYYRAKRNYLHYSMFASASTFTNNCSPGKQHANDVKSTHRRGRGDVVVRLLASHHGELISIPSGVATEIPHFRMWESCRTMPLAGGFSRGSPPFPPPLHSGVAPCSPRFTLIDSQDLDAKSGPNSSVHCPPDIVDRGPPTKANRVQSPAGSPDFRKWESYRTMSFGGFSKGSPVSPTLSFRRCSIPQSHSSALKTSLLRSTQISSRSHKQPMGVKRVMYGMPAASSDTIPTCGNPGATPPGLDWVGGECSSRWTTAAPSLKSSQSEKLVTTMSSNRAKQPILEIARWRRPLPCATQKRHTHVASLRPTINNSSIILLPTRTGDGSRRRAFRSTEPVEQWRLCEWRIGEVTSQSLVEGGDSARALEVCQSSKIGPLPNCVRRGPSSRLQAAATQHPSQAYSRYLHTFSNKLRPWVSEFRPTSLNLGTKLDEFGQAVLLASVTVISQLYAVHGRAAGKCVLVVAGGNPPVGRLCVSPANVRLQRMDGVYVTSDRDKICTA